MQYADAISDFDTAIRLKNDFARAYYTRGLAKDILGHIEEAKRDIQKALKLAEKAGDASLKASIEPLLKRYVRSAWMPGLEK